MENSKFKQKMRQCTKDHGDFFVGFGEWVRDTTLGEDNNGPIDGGSDPRYMGMPEESSPPAHDSEVVDIALARLYGALCHISRPVSPSTSRLPNPMPSHPPPFMAGAAIVSLSNIYIYIYTEQHPLFFYIYIQERKVVDPACFYLRNVNKKQGPPTKSVL